MVCGVVASVSRRKGHDLLLDAIAKNPALFEDMRFVFFGGISPGNEAFAEHIKARIQALGHAEKFVWVNHIEDVERAYYAVDFTMLPSRSEGLPRVVAESLYFGKPVVASNAGGTEEMIRENRLGQIFEVEDVQGLLEATQRFLESKTIDNQSDKEFCEAFVREHFSMNSFIKNFTQLVKGLVGK